MLRPAVIPFRWRHHGHDICAVIRDGRTAFVARDILLALERDLTPDLEKEPGHRDSPLALHAECTTFTLDQVHTILDGQDNPLYTECLEFLEWIAREIASFGDQDFARASTTPEKPAAVEPAHYSVAEAAEILSRDLGRPPINRTDLFQFLADRGWISRVNNVWVPQRDVIFMQYLVVIPNKIPTKTDLYPQVCITPLGLDVLHKRLGATTPLDLTPTTGALQ